MAELASPFPCLQVEISPDELREMAYELLLGAYEAKCAVSSPTREQSAFPSPIKSSAVRKFKKALAIGKKRNFPKHLGELELMRLQMEISEKSDFRIKKALSRALVSQTGSKPLIVPLELLQHTSAADFADIREYKKWQKRQLKVLEASFMPVDKENSGPHIHTLSTAIDQLAQGTQDKHPELLQNLRNSIRCKDGYWANVYPLNVHLYETLLRSIFDNLEETTFVDGFDEVMLLIKSTWDTLGINKQLHKICFVWVLFRQFVITGETEADFLKGAEMELREMDCNFDDDAVFDLLSATLAYIQTWAEKQLVAYHSKFPGGGKGLMETVAAVALNAMQVIHKSEMQQTMDPEDESELISNRVGIYIQSSTRYAFDEVLAQIRHAGALRLEKLADQTSCLIRKEKELFSQTFKIWHPHPVSVAAATLHSCYRMELRTFLSSLNEPSSEAIQALQAACELERKLLEMDMDDKGVFDPRSAIIPTMTPFTLDTDLRDPLKHWIQSRLDQMENWLERSAQQEEWRPSDTREHYALSAIEMLRIIEEALDAFFGLPVSQHPELLADIVHGVDSTLEQYVLFCLEGCANEINNFHDAAARREKEFAASLLGKVSEAWHVKQEVFGLQNGKARQKIALQSESCQEELATKQALSLQEICVRINTVERMQREIDFLEKKILVKWQEAPFTKQAPSIRLEKSRALCIRGIDKLCDIAANKVVLKDLACIFWQGLYIPSVSKARAGAIVDALNHRLEIIAGLISGRLRNKVVNHLMVCTFQEFLQVLADVNSTRTVNSNDVAAFGEDLSALKELFIADGEGLPESLVEDAAAPIIEFLASVQVEKEPKLAFKGAKLENLRTFLAKSKYQVGSPKAAEAPTSGSTSAASKMSAALGFKCQAMASKLVKRTYSFSKR